MCGTLSISAVARQAGVRPSAIRYYERLGLLPAPRRVNGRRAYGTEVAPRLALVMAAQQMGFTLAEIHTLIQGFSPETTAGERWRSLATRKLPEVEALIERAQGMKRVLEEMLHCECPTLEVCAQALQARDSA